MKLFLAILALSCATVFGMPEADRFKRDIQSIKESCPGKCIVQDKYREWFQQVLPKAREFGKQIAEGGDSTPVVPNLPAEKLDEICNELTTIRSCVSACNEPADAENKAKAEAILAAAADIVCNAEIKQHFPCLLDVGKTPSPTCNEQCKNYKQPILDAYQHYKQTGQRDWEKAKLAGKNACLLVNCRIKCRKNDIIQKCQEAGYATLKSLIQKLGVLAQTTHAQFRPTQNFPEECKPDSLISGS